MTWNLCFEMRFAWELLVSNPSQEAKTAKCVEIRNLTDSDGEVGGWCVEIRWLVGCWLKMRRKKQVDL